MTPDYFPASMSGIRPLIVLNDKTINPVVFVSALTFVTSDNSSGTNSRSAHMPCGNGWFNDEMRPSWIFAKIDTDPDRTRPMRRRCQRKPLLCGRIAAG
jgi:hypothetical protein